ncbi:MAG: tRNA dihydrouridine synthase DusB [Chthoniobacterales bacterium]
MKTGFPLFLAPMAGVTNTIFRRICKRLGADVVTSEFVSADGIFHRNVRTKEYLEFEPEERPVGVQLFGADPAHLAEAAKSVIEWVQPDFIDLNFGCPVNKVVCKNGGSALLKDCPLLEKVAKSVVNATSIPVTAKIRIGWSEDTINAVQTATILEQAGIQRIAVHGRTKEQGYSGLANWEVIGQVANAVSVPVIGNGDITCAAEALNAKEKYGVAGLMIGRAAMSNPWIFSEIRAAFEGSDAFKAPDMEGKWALISEHCRQEVARRGEERSAMHSMRGRLMAYTRGMPGGRHLRGKLQFVDSVAQLEDIAAGHLAELSLAA